MALTTGQEEMYVGRGAPANKKFRKERGMSTAGVLTLLLALLALFSGCALTPQENHSGMKEILQVPGMSEAALQSVEKMMSVAVMGFGYGCPTVTDIYVDDPEGGVLVATCFDGKTSANYKYVQSKDGQWYSVSPTEERGAVSLERRLREIISANGFACSKVTEVLFTNAGVTAQATCAEGKYKVVKDDAGEYTVLPW